MNWPCRTLQGFCFGAQAVTITVCTTNTGQVDFAVPSQFWFRTELVNATVKLQHTHISFDLMSKAAAFCLQILGALQAGFDKFMTIIKVVTFFQISFNYI